jgi:hypothetical protein
VKLPRPPLRAGCGADVDPRLNAFDVDLLHPDFLRWPLADWPARTRKFAVTTSIPRPGGAEKCHPGYITGRPVWEAS